MIENTSRSSISTSSYFSSRSSTMITAGLVVATKDQRESGFHEPIDAYLGISNPELAIFPAQQQAPYDGRPNGVFPRNRRCRNDSKNRCLSSSKTVTFGEIAQELEFMKVKQLYADPIISGIRPEALMTEKPVLPVVFDSKQQSDSSIVVNLSTSNSVIEDDFRKKNSVASRPTFSGERKQTGNCCGHVVTNISNECSSCGTERLRINVSGQSYETHMSLLDRHPDTLLGDPRKRCKYYDRCRREVFFDRHRPSFEAVFAYYQYGGRLIRPINIPDDVFLDELNFYQLEREVIDEYRRSEGYTFEEMILPTNETLKWIWMMFEYPENTKIGMIVAIVSVMMTLVSIVLFCVETLPVFSQSHCQEDVAPNFLDPFFIIETICTLWFTFEAIARFIACPNKLAFWKDFKNIVDVIAVVPYYVTFINVVSTMSCLSAKSSASLAFLRVIRLIRVFKLTKHSVGLQVLILTFKASIEGLFLFLVALMVCLLVFSSAIYYAEIDVKNSQIHSIPDAFWWAIITMTTVGYGDKVPVGLIGKLIGTACALTGVLTIAIPVPIITGHFNRFYLHKTGRGRNM